MTGRNTIKALIDLIFPNQCHLCGDTLKSGENQICISCEYNLPKQMFLHDQDNWMNKLFWGKAHINQVNSLLAFEKQNDTQKLIHLIKYNNQRNLAIYLGEMAGAFLKTNHAFNTAQALIPIPLHPKKLKSRGFNQSEQIAKGMANTMGIPLVNNYLLRSVDNTTQTNKSPFERWKNTEAIFTINPNTTLEEHHLLLIDDVLTTGATLAAAANTLTHKHQISLFTLACAHKI